MKVIGITGGIGSGKSLVTKIMEEKYGALVLNTDGIARGQMDPGGVSYREVVAFFGPGILGRMGQLIVISCR
jgi:dephospho-CoA kinase